MSYAEAIAAHPANDGSRAELGWDDATC